uniref:Uncharacterized protein n=1 Tax=Schistocephalus solidus TaxID=70667 RepID=A0A0V0JAS7_SCHSO
MFKQASNSTIRRHIAREVAQICSEVTEEVNMGTAKCKFQDKFTGDQEEILKKLDILAKRQLWMMKMLGRIYTSLRKVEESNLDKNQKYLQPVIERPVNPIDRPISSRSEFQDINGRLLDPGFRRQLVCTINLFSTYTRPLTSAASEVVILTISSSAYFMPSLMTKYRWNLILRAENIKNAYAVLSYMR